MNNRATIFRQIILKVVIPVLIVLVGIAYFNINSTIEILSDSHSQENKILADKISYILETQDYALGLINENIEHQVQKYSTELVTNVFKDTEGIENANLDKIQSDLGMNPGLVDIYVIDYKGYIVNTTAKKDLGLHLFQWPALKSFLLERFEDKSFKSDNFSPEKNTNKLKKYSYQATLDGKYLIELGVYSSKADEITKVTTHKLNGISHNPKHKTIQSVDLFIGEEKATSFNSDDTLTGFQTRLFQAVLDYKNAVLEDINTVEGYQDTRDTIVFVNDKKIHYQFTYMPRKNSTIYQDSVIRIISDRSIEEEVKNEMIVKFSLIFGVIVLLLIVILMFVTRSITNPIKNLVESVHKISEGNLSIRADVVGSKEIAMLAFNFNHMISELEVLYNNLEDKVKERTAEIKQAMEEIEAQRDHIEEQRDSILKSNSELETAYKDIEDKNTRITDSVHYAKRIQTAVLPTSEQLKNLLDDYFVLYRPKDIVSGDFYWAAEKNGKSVIIAADCTGHGVPGAFMSLIGNNLLNRIVLELDITDPAEILNRMRSEIITSLKQTSNTQDSKDGMDVSMCVFDKTKRTVEFAGAHNPFLLVRDNKLTLIKGDKMPVGYFVGDMNPFKTHTIELQKGDMIYIYSDGYQDQFGGEEGRKFMSKRFKVLLTDLANSSVELQKENLENTMDEWMINTKQLDDILVIGVKIN